MLGGIVAGVVWAVESSAITALWSKEFVAQVPGGRLVKPSGALAVFLLFVAVVMGIWAIWVYAAIRPRYGAGPRAAVITGLAWWLIAICADADWTSLGFVTPGSMLVPTVTALPALVIAALAGGWIYRE